MADGSVNPEQLAARALPRQGGPSVVLVGYEEIAGEIQQAVAACGGTCEFAVDVGDPASVIERVASELHADVIVVGQSRHRRMHPLGSVPARLAHQADHPVLIVP